MSHCYKAQGRARELGPECALTLPLQWFYPGIAGSAAITERPTEAAAAAAQRRPLGRPPARPIRPPGGHSGRPGTRPPPTGQLHPVVPPQARQRPLARISGPPAARQVHPGRRPGPRHPERQRARLVPVPARQPDHLQLQPHHRYE